MAILADKGSKANILLTYLVLLCFNTECTLMSKREQRNTSCVVGEGEMVSLKKGKKELEGVCQTLEAEHSQGTKMTELITKENIFRKRM